MHRHCWRKRNEEFLPKSAAKMADCLMKRYGLLTSRWSYDYGVAWRGMEALYAP